MKKKEVNNRNKKDNYNKGKIKMKSGAAEAGGCGGVYTPPIIENFQFFPATRVNFLYVFFQDFFAPSGGGGGGAIGRTPPSPPKLLRYVYATGTIKMPFFSELTIGRGKVQIRKNESSWKVGAGREFCCLWWNHFRDHSLAQ